MDAIITIKITNKSWSQMTERIKAVHDQFTYDQVKCVLLWGDVNQEREENDES